MPDLRHQGYGYGQRWLSKYGRKELLNTVIRVKMRSEDDRIKELESENRRLKIALADAVLAKDVPECLIEESDSRYGMGVKKIWTSTVRRCSKENHQPVKGMWNCFDYSRTAYYRSLKVNGQTRLSETATVAMVRRECRVQPRFGGRKLYHIPGADIRTITPYSGRDRFFSLLCRSDLLVKRKHSYTQTACSWYHFHKYGNPIRDASAVCPDQVRTSDITYLHTEKKFVYLSLITDMYSRRMVG